MSFQNCHINALIGVCNLWVGYFSTKGNLQENSFFLGGGYILTFPWIQYTLAIFTYFITLLFPPPSPSLSTPIVISLWSSYLSPLLTTPTYEKIRKYLCLWKIGRSHEFSSKWCDCLNRPHCLCVLIYLFKLLSLDKNPSWFKDSRRNRHIYSKLILSPLFICRDVIWLNHMELRCFIVSTLVSIVWTNLHHHNCESVFPFPPWILYSIHCETLSILFFISGTLVLLWRSSFQLNFLFIDLSIYSLVNPCSPLYTLNMGGQPAKLFSCSKRFLLQGQGFSILCNHINVLLLFLEILAI